MMKTLFLCSSVALLFTMMNAYAATSEQQEAQSLSIVEQGVPRAVIVMPEHASGILADAAAFMTCLLQQSTGAHIALYRENHALADSQSISIHIGLTAYVRTLQLDYASLDADGFLIHFPDRAHIVVLGSTDWGTEFGVYEFLERYVGVRWLFPGPDGQHVPSLQTIAIPMQNVREEPAFFSRELSGLRLESQLLWARRNRMHGRVEFHHNLYKLFPPEQYAQTHPEFFPIVNGQRYFPPPDRLKKWQPCFSAAGLIEEGIKNICRYFAEHPQERSYSLGMNDTSQQCECEMCLELDAGRQNIFGYRQSADRYFTWANAVVEGVLKFYPNKWFGCLAYNNLLEPPTEVFVHPRILPYMTYDRMKWIDAAEQERGLLLTERWQQKSPLLGWYDYIYGTPYLLPRVYFHAMAAYYRAGHQRGARALYAEAYPNWGEGPKLYLALKLQWNPNLDVDAVLHDWYVCAVGEQAAPDLAAYYQHWETFWTERVPVTAWFQSEGQYLRFKSPDYLEAATYADLTESRARLEQALAKTQTPQQRRRAELLLRAFEYYEASAISYLGLVKNIREPDKSEDYYREMNAKRLRLVNEFEKDPMLMHPIRFDREGFSDLQW